MIHADFNFFVAMGVIGFFLIGFAVVSDLIDSLNKENTRVREDS